MEVPFHIFLKSMEQKTITYEEFFTPGFFKFAFFPHSFLIVIKFMELWNNGYFNRLLIYPGRKSSLGSSPGSSANGRVAQWSSASVQKTEDPQGSKGSNPFPSSKAMKYILFGQFIWSFHHGSHYLNEETVCPKYSLNG